MTEKLATDTAVNSTACKPIQAHGIEARLNHMAFHMAQCAAGAQNLEAQDQVNAYNVLNHTHGPTAGTSLKSCSLSACAGEDICREVSAVAEQVIISARSWRDPGAASDPRPFGPHNNISKQGMVSALHPDGRVEFTQVSAIPLPDNHSTSVSMRACCRAVTALRL